MGHTSRRDTRTAQRTPWEAQFPDWRFPIPHSDCTVRSFPLSTLQASEDIFVIYYRDGAPITAMRTVREDPMTHEIIEPEPHSKPRFGGGWEHIPRWLRIVLSAIAIGAVILGLYLTR